MTIKMIDDNDDSQYVRDIHRQEHLLVAKNKILKINPQMTFYSIIIVVVVVVIRSGSDSDSSCSSRSMNIFYL